MNYSIKSENGGIRILMAGQFTFTDNQKFREMMDYVDDHKPHVITLDFAETDFIDSAGLGMLLLLRDTCNSKNITISFQSVTGQVKKIFAISKFDQLFAM